MADIRLEKVQYSYQNHGQVFPALEDMDIHIRDGEFVCILGSSGCGKTTLLRLIAGLQQPTKGCVYIGGKAVEGPGTDRAIVFQNYTLFPWMTVRKNVCFGIQQAQKGCGKKEADAMALQYLNMVGMVESADRYPYQLSGGMKQRVAIARALAMDADILLLDEPFGALDSRNRRELQELLLKLWTAGEGYQAADAEAAGEERETAGETHKASGEEHKTAGRVHKTVVFVTHDIAEAVLLADRILYMKPGRIAADIPVDHVRPRNLQDTDLKTLQNTLGAMFYENEDENGGREARYETSL